MLVDQIKCSSSIVVVVVVVVMVVVILEHSYCSFCIVTKEI